MQNRRVDWNIGGAERGPEEVQVKFSNELDLDDNLETVIEILRDRYEVELEEIHVAAGKVFGEDDPDALFTTSMEEIKSRQEALIVEAVDEAIEAREAKEEMSQP